MYIGDALYRQLLIGTAYNNESPGPSRILGIGIKGLRQTQNKTKNVDTLQLSKASKSVRMSVMSVRFNIF